MSKFDYNVVVIGAGSAGLVSSYIAAATKAKVALIEKGNMGGDCLNTGCVPSKALLRSTTMLSYASRAKEFGFKATNVEFDFAEVMRRVHSMVEAIAPHDSIARYTKLGVDCIEGKARVISPHKVEVNGRTISARAIIIASGAAPMVPPISGLDALDYLTSDNVWDLKELPKRLVVLGGGPIGVEMAQAFARLGSLVTLVEMLPQILTREDDDVIKYITDQFKHENINVLTNHKAKKFTGNMLSCDANGKNVDIHFDKVIVALGRKANIKDFGLEALGVKIRDQGTLQANAFMQTNIPSIYVCGDVTGPFQFTHTAAHQAWYAVVNALFSPFKRFKVDYRTMPWATFCDPEIARVGLNEKEAKQKNINYDVSVYLLDELDRAIVDSEARGMVKVLTKPGNDKILGATIVGAHAGDLIAEYILAMKHGIGLNKILGTIHIYPTMVEANKYVAGVWKKSHVPEIALKLLEIFHRWRRL